MENEEVVAPEVEVAVEAPVENTEEVAQFRNITHKKLWVIIYKLT